MSRVTRIKHLKREDDSDNFDLPTAEQKIVRIKKSAGNNLHEVEDPDSPENYLVSMPSKFRKSFWIKRGDFVIVEMIAEGEKVKAEIVRILNGEHVKEFTRAGVWPKLFQNKREHEPDDIDDDLENNPNRKCKTRLEADEVDSSSDSE